jgi:hypothetical protein
MEKKLESTLADTPDISTELDESEQSDEHEGGFDLETYES